MTLPESLQQSFDTKLKNYQEERKMPILSNMERRAMETGIQQGFQNSRNMVLEVLNERFTPLPAEVIDRINQISDYETLKQLLKRGMSIGSLAEFEEVLASIMTDN